jgi:hypothetical protein
MCTRISRVDKCATSTENKEAGPLNLAFLAAAAAKTVKPVCQPQLSAFVPLDGEATAQKSTRRTRARTKYEKGPHYRIRTHYLSPLLCFIVITWHLNKSTRRF